jgi:(5-formylfuran-3-yl)methyl phosphate synthase
MTRMLASVTGPQEAEIALAGGADIIDVQDPAGGAHDRAAAIRATVQAVGGRRPVSALAGDLPMPADGLLAAVRAIAATGVDTVGLRILPGADMAGCLCGLAEAASGAKLVGVFLAETAPDLSLLPALRRGGFAGAMIDTGDKASGRLLDHLDLPRLLGFVEDCHASGLDAGLSGSLEPPDVPRLLVLSPDLLGFRGALCGVGERWGSLDLAHVQAIRGLIPPELPARADVDYRLLAARGYAPAAVPDGPVDRVFVEDLVLPVSIGAYAWEREAPQNVRFSVSAWVVRGGRAAEDMRDVFSYDLITDGIRLLTASGHVGLVETLAERIAAMVLAHARVARVMVRVQKLDTGSGTVGVEIERTRAAARMVAPTLAEAAGFGHNRS